jgi:hypothetical protein
VRFFAVILFLTFATLARGADPDRSGTPSPKARCAKSAITMLRLPSTPGQWGLAETRNFRIYWRRSKGDLCDLAERCEQLAAFVKEAWFGHGSGRAWSPKCDVIVHSHLEEYTRALGVGSEQTSGCATIRLDEGRVVLRRIDLRADGPEWNSEALPHELTHIVLADRFCQTMIPPWADEGISLLSESPQRLKQRLAAMREAASGGCLYGPSDLIQVKTSPPQRFRAAFYGQSVAFVSFLLEHGTRQQLLDFIATSQKSGFDAALGAVYGIQRPSQFVQQFQEYVSTERPLAWARQSVVAAVIRSLDTRLPE